MELNSNFNSEPSAIAKGERFYHQGDFFKGVDFWTLFLEHEPGNLRAYMLRALCYDGMCNEDDMQADFETILRLAPDSAEAAFARGMQLRWKAHEEAIEQFSRAIEKNPALADAFEFRGWIKLHDGDIEGAEADFSACLAIYPQHAMALLLRADAYLRLKDFYRRAKDLEAYLDFYPGTLMQESLSKQIAGCWIRLAAKAAAKKRQLKRQGQRFWKEHQFFNGPIIWTDLEDRKS